MAPDECAECVRIAEALTFARDTQEAELLGDILRVHVKARHPVDCGHRHRATHRRKVA